MTIFSRGIASAFRVFGETARYFAAGAAAGVDVTVITEVPVVEQAFGNTSVKLAAAAQAQAKTLHVRRSEAAAPRKDEIFELGGTRLVVEDVTLDATGEIWVLPTRVRKP